VHPQNYKKYRHNLNGMNKELQQIMARKRLWVTVSGILFGLGSVLLTVLIGVIIWEA
jgi:ABC-type microcin C transport system permease subunit YejE